MQHEDPEPKEDDTLRGLVYRRELERSTSRDALCVGGEQNVGGLDWAVEQSGWSRLLWRIRILCSAVLSDISI